MIILASLFLILLMLVAASWFIIPLCIFSSELYSDITRSLRLGKPFPFGGTIASALGVFIAGCFSAFAIWGLNSDLNSLWNSQKHPGESEKTRDILLTVPEKVRVHTEFRLDDTVIGKEVL
jgi:hypothetical protein